MARRAKQQAKAVGRAFGQTYFTEYGNQFFFRVVDRQVEIEENLADKFAPFFQNMRKFVGLEGTPNPVRRMGVRWAPLTQKWRDYKFKKRNKDRDGSQRILGSPDEHKFYKGVRGLRGKGVFGFLGKKRFKDANDVYGAPDLFIKTSTKRYLNRRQIKNLEEGQKAPMVNRNDIDWDGKTLRYRGSFANINNLLDISMGFRMTPNVEDEEDYYAPFASSEHVAGVLRSNDFGDAAEPRPFLRPMLDYYQDVVLPNEFIRSAME